MKKKHLLFIILIFIASCTQKTYLRKITEYLNASTVDEKARFMADNYHSYFMEATGEGENKNASLQSFQNWDAPLHPQIDITSYTVDKNIWKVKFNEQNDFSKLISFPGWKGTEVITFNSQKLIEQTVYIPDSTNPSYKKWLQPAVDWLQITMPDSLVTVYQNGRLIQNEESAKKWMRLLKQWKKVQTKQQ
ncbi:MAG TPA: hypothetical protein VH396_08925 [Chitinophagaceae bacterium]|jgi:hypothetical protein